MQLFGHIYNIVVMLSLTVIVVCLCVANDPSELETRMYAKETAHGLNEICLQNCGEKLDGVFKTRAQCATKCRQNCIGITLDDDGSCYTFKPCIDPVSVSGPPFTLHRKKNPCQHDSVWNVTTDTCACIDGWVGNRCQRLPKHCYELRIYGYSIEWGQHRLRVNLSLDTYPTPIEVRCEVFEGYANTMIMYNTGKYSNNKTWNDFLNGFYHDETNFWLGLKKMKALNDDGLKVVNLNTGFASDSGYSLFQRAYRGFQFHSDFTFNFSKASVLPNSGPYRDTLDYGDCLTSMIGAKFSTWDNDQDEDGTRNCAKQAGVGWWFKDCSMTCNPMGWNPKIRPDLGSKSLVKMDGIDFSLDRVQSSDITMYFTPS